MLNDSDNGRYQRSRAFNFSGILSGRSDKGRRLRHTGIQIEGHSLSHGQVGTAELGIDFILQSETGIDVGRARVGHVGRCSSMVAEDPVRSASAGCRRHSSAVARVFVAV